MAVQVNIATILPALEQISETALRVQFEQEPATYNMFEQDTESRFVNGKGFRIPSYLLPPTGIGSIGDGGSFKQPGAQVFDDMYIAPKNLTMAFELTGRMLRNANDASSLLKGLSGQLELQTQALRKEANIQVFNDGTGVRSIFKSNSSGVLTLYNAIDHTPTTAAQVTKGGVHMRVGESYDWYDPTLAIYRTTITPSAKTNKTITIASGAVPGTTLDGDILVLSTTLYKAPNGLAHIVNNDTGTFQLQSRSTYPQLRSPVTDLAGAAIQVSTFSYTKRLLEARAGVGKAKKVMAILSLAQDDALTRLGQNYKRFDGDAKKFDGSFDAFGHGDTLFHKDGDVGESDIWLVVPSEIKRFVEKPFGLYDHDGNTLRMRSGITGYGSDAWTGAIGAHYNYGTPEPRYMAAIKRCAVTGLATQVAANA